MTVDFRHGRWLNQPQSYEITPDAVTIRTDPHTDFWQRSYYGFPQQQRPGAAAAANGQLHLFRAGRF
jgi:regulation of enolase protein 1 (concanavalin A-like superfamily)